MKSDIFNSEIIESYLSNSLPEEERLEFEIRLRTDKEFAEFVSIFTELDFAIAEDDVMDLRQSLGSIHEVLAREWQDEAPMIVKDPGQDEIDRAIGEEDIMQLRAMLNDLHDLNREETEEQEKYEKVAALDNSDLAMMLQNMDQEAETWDFLDEDISAAILEDDVMSLRASLTDIGRDISSPVREKRSLYRKVSRLTAIASIIILMLIGGTTWVALDSTAMKPEKVVTKFFAPPQGKGVTRAAVKFKIASEDAAFENYRNGEYITAVHIFRELIETGQDIDEIMATAFIGFSLFNAGMYEEAAAELKTVVEDNSNVWVDPAEWIQAGCLLRDKESQDEAIALLKRIARKPDHEYNELSWKVLKKIKH